MTQPLWQIHHIDCRKYLKTLDPKSISAVITDPPYGIKAKPTKHSERWKILEPIAGDKSLKMTKYLYAWCKDNKVPLAMFYSPFLPRPGKFKSILCWDKGYVGMPGDTKRAWKRTFELIGVAFNEFLNGSQDPSVIKVTGLKVAKHKATTHFCEKPVELMSYLVRKLVKKGETRPVLDPFVGSGSTLVACCNYGVPCIGLEIDEKWAKRATDRLSRFKQPRLKLFEEF